MTWVAALLLAVLVAGCTSPGATPAAGNPAASVKGLTVEAATPDAITFRITVQVVNPAPVEATLKRLVYTLSYLDGGQYRTAASGESTQPVTIPAGGSAPVEATVSITSAEVVGALRTAHDQKGRLTLKVQGTAEVEVLGKSVQLPFEAVKEVNLPAVAKTAVEQGRGRIRGGA